MRLSLLTPDFLSSNTDLFGTTHQNIAARRCRRHARITGGQISFATKIAHFVSVPPNQFLHGTCPLGSVLTTQNKVFYSSLISYHVRIKKS